MKNQQFLFNLTFNILIVLIIKIKRKDFDINIDQNNLKKDKLVLFILKNFYLNINFHLQSIFL